jgi:hypothetical protein
MFRLPFILKRSLAVLLPVCFVWVFVACVIICTAHAAEEQSQYGVCSASETELSQDTQCCPISVSQVSLLACRRSPILQVGGEHCSVGALPAKLLPGDWLAYTRPTALPLLADWPLKRLRALRI